MPFNFQIQDSASCHFGKYLHKHFYCRHIFIVLLCICQYLQVRLKQLLVFQVQDRQCSDQGRCCTCMSWELNKDVSYFYIAPVFSNSSVICLYAHYCEKSSQFEATSNDDIGSFWLESQIFFIRVFRSIQIFIFVNSISAQYRRCKTKSVELF